ncbi:glycoside hydrolase family 18 protein [Lederbergia citri]|uniref:chitinase n=1 Tax=Lederbergia citri TaxID=2833580 RepID=A0A942YJL9_9BACI|nr:glycoside hydrolase family 18 protein [Lederbergia citri]MBS4196506.1 glycoside hydrolase family 18 protein [Lederbergia citri]
MKKRVSVLALLLLLFGNVFGAFHLVAAQTPDIDSSSNTNVTTTSEAWEPADKPPANRVVGYFASWSTYGSFNIMRDLDASRLTHLNYAFAVISNDLKVVMGDPEIDPINFEEIALLKEKYPHLQTLISVGGWEGSANFSEAAANEESRTIFAESAVDFILKYGFDGVDLDWEYPVTGGGTGTYPNPADKENFPLLLEKVREKLDEQGEKDGKHYLLTIAGGATASFASNASLGFTHQYLDYVQIMTYDIHGPWESVADFTAPLFDDNGKTYSVDRGIQAYLDAGVPADKLVMGIPFYGYQYNVTSTENNGLRQPVSGGSGAITYNNIMSQDLLNNGYERFWNEGSKVPYLFNKETLHFISHDDEESIGLKAEYIRDRGLGGAMIWELSQDYRNQLLSKIYNVLKGPDIEPTFANLYQLVDKATIDHGQQNALLAHIKSAENAKTDDQRKKHLNNTLKFVEGMNGKHIDAESRQGIVEFLKKMIAN